MFEPKCYAKEKLKIPNTHTGTHKRVGKKGNGNGLVEFLRGERRGGGGFRKNFGVYSKESTVPILNPTLTWQLHFMAP